MELVPAHTAAMGWAVGSARQYDVGSAVLLSDFSLQSSTLLEDDAARCC